MDIVFKTKKFAKNFIWLSSVESTNSFIKQNQENLQDKTVVATLNQTKGRGTKNRKFLSVPSKTLAVSVFFKNFSINLINHLPKVFSVGLIKCLNNFKVNSCKIKWFNDITINEKKIAGILCESSIFKKTTNCVVGVGINLLATEKELKSLNLFKAGSVFSETKIQIKPEDFLKNFIETLELTYLTFLENCSEEKLIKLNNLFQNNCETIKKSVKVFSLSSKELFTAKAVGISLNGNLLVKLNNKTYSLNCSKFSVL